MFVYPYIARVNNLYIEESILLSNASWKRVAYSYDAIFLSSSVISCITGDINGLTQYHLKSIALDTTALQVSLNY